MGGLLLNPFPVNKGILPSGTDFNDVIDNGLYKLTGGTYSNIPGNSYGALSVLSYPNYVTFQMYIAALATGGNTYIRQCFNNVWTTWIKLN